MKRNKIVSVYFTENELNEVFRAADKDERAVAPFIRIAVLDKIKKAKE